VNTLCSYLAGPHGDGVPDAAHGRGALARLADDAHAAIAAGWTGEEVRRRWPIGTVMTADVALDLLDLLAKHAERIGRQCEIVLRPDGSGEVMAAEEFCQEDPPEGFESIAQFGSIEALRAYLETGKL
jgi:hypothetical protein